VDLRHLKYLVAVADAGTIARAAEQLRVAQPALTRQLKDLQRELQVDLLVPGARRATLTAAGETAVRLARDLIRGAERAVERARLAETGRAGRCVLVVGPLAVLSGLLARLVARIKEGYPDLQLVVLEAAGKQQWNAIRQGRADIALGIAPPADRYPMLANESQYMDRVDAAFVAPHHPLASRPSVPLDELSRHPFYALEDIGSETDRVKALLAKELRIRGATSASINEVVGVDDLLAHVRVGRGWTFLPRRMISSSLPLTAVSIEGFSVPFRTSRTWRLSEAQPAVLTVLEELRCMEREAEGGACVDAPTPAYAEHRYAPPRLELRHARSFAAVASSGSFGRAATSRHITQPALSRQMRALELDLGVRLFQRGSRGVDLTASGDVFLRDVAGLLADVDRFHKEVHRAQRGTLGRCVLGVVPHRYVDRILNDVLDSLAKMGARIQIEVRVLTTPQLGDALRKSEIDIAIAYAYPMPVAQMDGLVRRPLFDDELNCALLPATHPFADRETVSLADLKDVPLLVPRRGVLPRLYDAVLQQFTAAGVVPRIDAEYEGARTIRSLIVQGLGWALGTRTQINDPPAGTRCVPLRDFHLSWGAEVVFRQDESRPAVLVLPRMIADAARRVIPGGAPGLARPA
jgi:DNA-binding transcriptional LysR family regulator